MGSNNSTTHNQSVIMHNWMQLEQHSDIFINRVTTQQVQRHRITIPLQAYPQQMTSLAKRMHEHHQFVCAVIYFHEIDAKNGSGLESREHQKEVEVYTNRMISIKNWSKSTVIGLLKGIKKLVSLYGCFRINEKMLCENEKAEAKVWISQSPTFNRKDQDSVFEDECLADFAGILIRKNEQLTNYLIGCTSFKQALQKIEANNEHEIDSKHNYSYRPIVSPSFPQKESHQTANTPWYRNVFHQQNITPTNQSNYQTIRPNHLTPQKTIHTHNLSPFKAKDYSFQDNKANYASHLNFRTNPTTNATTHHTYQPKQRTQGDRTDHKSSPKFVININHESHLQIAKRSNMEHHLQTPPQTMHHEGEFQNEPKLAYFRQTPQQIRQTPQQNANLRKPASIEGNLQFKAITNQASTVHANIQKNQTEKEIMKFLSPRAIIGKEKVVYSSEGSQNNYQFMNSNAREKSFKKEPILIINNNVNNYIHNITHQILQAPSPVDLMQSQNINSKQAPDQANRFESQQFHPHPERYMSFNNPSTFSNTIPILKNNTSSAAYHPSSVSYQTKITKPKEQFKSKEGSREGHKESMNVPKFILERKKPASHSDEVEEDQSFKYENPSNSNECNAKNYKAKNQILNYNAIARKDTIHSNPPEEKLHKVSAEKDSIYFSAKPDTQHPPHFPRRDAKLYTFSNIDHNHLTLSKNKQAPSKNQSQIQNHSQQNQTFSHEQIIDTKFHRTKTTDFKNANQNKYSQYFKKQAAPSKENTDNQFANQKYLLANNQEDHFQPIFGDKDKVKEDISEPIATTKSIEVDTQHRIQKPKSYYQQNTESPLADKLQIKKQLKMEFGFLLNEPESQEKISISNNYLQVENIHKNKSYNVTQNSNRDSPHKHSEEIDEKTPSSKLKNASVIFGFQESKKEITVKDKIEKKKAAFAELKFQALKVLSDD